MPLFRRFPGQDEASILPTQSLENHRLILPMSENFARPASRQGLLPHYRRTKPQLKLK